MVRDVIKADFTKNDWRRMRGKIHQKIYAAMGKFPPLDFSGKFQSLSKSVKHDLEHEEISFEILPGYICHGTMVYPQAGAGKRRVPAAVCIHGTDHELARYNMLRPEIRTRRAYAIELAQRGYLTIAVDQFGFGDWTGEISEKELYHRFSHDYPGWSLDGIRLYIQQCAVTILSCLPQVDKEQIASIGHSLGGRTSVYLAAFDERVKAAIVSAGLSANVISIYCNYATEQVSALSPLLNESALKNGVPIWEYQELMALAAPRCLVVVESFNDPCCPFIETRTDCVLKARFVYELYGKPENITYLCHGCGHDTPYEIRQYCYLLLDKYFNRNQAGRE